MATEKECRRIWHAGWVQGLFHQAPLQNRSQAQTQSLDPELQKMYSKCTQAGGDCKLKAPYARGKRNPSVKHKLREKKAGEQFLGTRTSLCSLLSPPKGNCFYGAGKQCHFCSSLYSNLPAAMGFSLACGSKNITEILYGYSHLLFPLSQNYLLQNGPVWGLCPNEPYRQHKLSA